MAIKSYPNFGPWAHDQSNFLWIDITVLEMLSQNTLVRSNGGDVGTTIPVRNTGVTYRLLAPPEVQYSGGHTWDDYENITSRLANVISSWAQPYQDVQSVIGNLLSQGPTALKNASTSQGIWEAIKTTVGAEVVQYRVDSPIVYKRSEAIRYLIPFEFAVYSNSNSTNSSGYDIFNMINDLVRYSCPKRKNDDFIKITPPNIFHIQTFPPTNMFNIQRAAITSFNISMQEHYHHGYPSKMQAQLEFQDITPLFEDKFPRAGYTMGIVTTGLSGLAPGE